MATSFLGQALVEGVTRELGGQRFRVGAALDARDGHHPVAADADELDGPSGPRLRPEGAYQGPTDAVDRGGVPPVLAAVLVELAEAGVQDPVGRTEREAHLVRSRDRRAAVLGRTIDEIPHDLLERSVARAAGCPLLQEHERAGHGDVSCGSGHGLVDRTPAVDQCDRTELVVPGDDLAGPEPRAVVELPPQRAAVGPDRREVGSDPRCDPLNGVVGPGRRLDTAVDGDEHRIALQPGGDGAQDASGRCARPQDRLEQRVLKVGGAAEGVDLPLDLRMRAPKLGQHPVLGLAEACVLDADRREVGERDHPADIGVRERRVAPSPHLQHPEHLAAEHERHGERRARTLLLG